MYYMWRPLLNGTVEEWGGSEGLKGKRNDEEEDEMTEEGRMEGGGRGETEVCKIVLKKVRGE